MDISAVRLALATQCDDVVDPGGRKLHCLGFVPTSVPEPCFYAGEVEIEPNVTFGDDEEILIRCRVLVSMADDRQGQLRLDKFLSRTGSSSIRAAIMADQTLGGLVDTLVVEKITGYGMYEIGVDRFFGAEIPVRIWG